MIFPFCLIQAAHLVLACSNPDLSFSLGHDSFVVS